MTKPQLSLLIITLLAFTLRVVNLNNIPGILNRDEAALAYNAVLLKETGQDEWQKPWPLALESFGDYKLPGYVLSLVMLFSVLPKEDWVVRLPAAVAGTMLVPIGYWLAKKWRYDNTTALVLASFVGTSPVFFFYSRMAFEAILALSLWLVFHGLILNLPTTNPKKILLDGVTILVVLLATLTYNTPFLLLPFTILAIPLLRGFKIWKNWLTLVIGTTLIFALIGLTMLPLTAQKKGITIFSDETTLTKAIEYRQSLPVSLQSTLGHKYLYFAGQIGKNFIHSFSPQFLVIKGGSHPWHTQPGFSHFTWTIYLLGLVGIGSTLLAIGRTLYTNKASLSTHSRQISQLYLLLISLAPAVITVDAPHATRSLPFLFWWLFFAVEGLLAISNILKPKRKKKGTQLAPVLIAVSLILCLVEFGWYSYNYFTRYSLQQPDALRVGFDQAIKKAEERYPNTQIAVVDGEGFHYILTAWYLQLSPEEYFSTVVRQQPNTIGFRYGEQVANYHFIAHDTDRVKTGETVLLNWIDNQWQIQQF